MAVVIDTSRALRTLGDLSSFVRAIAAALPEDELDWIEWKCAGDLSDKATQGTIARHILGMANRRPEQAALRAQGCGYLVMGVEPGSLHGITPIDPSQLDQGVQHYLGPDGPAWSLQYVQKPEQLCWLSRSSGRSRDTGSSPLRGNSPGATARPILRVPRLSAGPAGLYKRNLLICGRWSNGSSLRHGVPKSMPGARPARTQAANARSCGSATNRETETRALRPLETAIRNRETGLQIVEGL
jgi:hypothetical protein